MKVKEHSKKAGLKLNIQKTKIMESTAITSWQIDRETMEAVTDFIFLGSKISADSDCSHEIKRCLLLGRKAVTKLDSMLKSRGTTLQTKIPRVKAMVFLGEGNGNPLQCLCLEKPMDGGAWQVMVHGIEKNWIQLND